MRIPYVIDNDNHRMADVLSSILTQHDGKSLDVATAYFNVRGFTLLHEGLERLGSFRLLLGDEPKDGPSVGLRPRAALQLAADLNAAPFDEPTLRAVEDLIAFLRRDLVAVRAYQKGFLHAKCYLFYGDLPTQTADRFQPLVAIVGSSNFTGPGLTTNRELNVSHKAVLTPEEVTETHLEVEQRPRIPNGLDAAFAFEEKRRLMGTVGATAIQELDRWFQRQWDASRDFKQDLIDLLDASKFGQKEYTPYQVYMKALFEYFKDDLMSMPSIATRSAVELAEFQEDAVKKARKILATYDGVLVGDSVGLGKTWIGKKLLEDYAYHQRMKAVVVCPASLRKMWTDELQSVSIAAIILSQEELGQGDFEPGPYGDADILLVDESHNFRNRNTQRYESLERIISAHAGRGKAGSKKKLILMTATPVNNDIFDLYNQITLFTGGDRSYFAGAGIGDLYRYFIAARRTGDGQSSGVTLFNLLEEVVIRRTRAFIRKAYPEAMIRGKPIKWPERRLKTLRYNLEATYAGIYDRVVDAIEGLRLAPYQLETYKKTGVKRDEFEQGREEALAGIFKARYLKRFESSVEAFRISIRRAMEFTKTFEAYVLDGKLLDSANFRNAMRYLVREDEEDDGTPTSRAEELDATEEAKEVLEALPKLDTSLYDLRRLHEALQADVDALAEIWGLIRDVKPEKDAKLQVLKDLLSKDLKGQKAIVFTYYKDTARYLYRELTGDNGKDFLKQAGDPVVRRMDSGSSPRNRARLIALFAPRSNNRPDLVGSADEVDVLISTDVLSEGQNLQDCGLLINYDLHWNPTRMVQRAGRIDRIGSEFPVLWIYNTFPDEGLERLLRLVQSLTQKINAIDKTGFLDASVLGEIVHPRTFNTLRRIMEEDGRVVEEQEQFAELASNEFLLQQLRALLETGAREMLEGLPDGIHSGLARAGERGMFFYFTTPGGPKGGRRHFWRYYDIQRGRVIDNRFLIANLIACAPDTPRVIGDADVFAIQDKVIGDILRSEQEQQAVEAAPKVLDPLQQTAVTLLQPYLNSSAAPRNEVKEALRRLQAPMAHVALRDLRKAYERFVKDQDLGALLASIRSLEGSASKPQTKEAGVLLAREDLHLICFDYVWS